MTGKGSRQRPLGVNKAVFDNNWDNIFNKDKEKDMWEHTCKHNGKFLISKNESCSWCGATEND